VGNLSATTAELQEAWQHLYQRWEQTKGLWSDRVSWQFERDFWQPLEKQVPATLKEMDRLAEVIAAAHRSVR
jgi:hypothetical protein